MANEFKIKQGDTKPYLSVTLQSSDGTAVDLTSATVEFSLADSDFTNVRSASANITDASAGEVEYRWAGTGDTDSDAGVYYGEFKVTYADTKVQTFPPGNDLVIRIYDDYEV